MTRAPRSFLGWDRPVLATTVDFLTQDWDGRGMLDLSDRLVVVPTRHAGRRLREALAQHAAAFEAAVLPPRIVTPNYLFSPERLPSTNLPLAKGKIVELVWTMLLLELPLDSFRHLFPVDPVSQDLDWAMRQARELLAVRDLLIESSLDLGEAATRLGEEGIERQRWENLARIESLAGERLRAAGFEDPGSAALTIPQRGALLETVRRIVIAAVPDLRPLAAQALEHFASAVPVHILIAAPESASDAFDRWGRPLPGAWAIRPIPFANPDETLHACASPLDQAEYCERLLQGYEDPAAIAAIGLPDPELAPAVAQGLAAAGIRTYDPAGRSLSRSGLCEWIRLLRDLLASESFTTFGQLLRCPGFAEAMRGNRQDDWAPLGKILREADDLAAEHLPAGLDEAREAVRKNPDTFSTLAPVLDGFRSWMKRLRKEAFSEVLCDLLAAGFAGRRLDPHDAEAVELTETADAIHGLDRDLESLPAASFSVEERFALLLSDLQDRSVYGDREPRDLDLQGWLELIFEDAPHLLVTGMNDHAVPESVVGHAFLPDSARSLLGIPENAARFARDAYVLTLLVETRRTEGRLDLLFGRFGSGGEPLRPSRLLFQCQDHDLAQRTLHLFGESENDPQPLARTVAWRLRPRELPDDHRIFQRIRVTGFRDYLACPFRFFLKHGLGMESVQSGKCELDSRDFGNLVHAALEAFGKDPAIRDSTDASEIAAYFEAEIDRWFDFRFGPRLSTPLVIQREAALRRLRFWSRIEAEQRAEGWRIIEVESPLGFDDRPFSIDGMPVSGRVDRIERHPDLGLRVCDFKTRSATDAYGKAKPIERYHLVNVKRTESVDDFPEWALTVDGAGKAFHWIDLQLPLYRLALAERFPDTSISVAYATLGRTVDEVRLDPWESLDETLLESARTCAAGVIASIRERIFWPPNEHMPEWDEFHSLLSPTAEESVDPTGLSPRLNPL